MKLKSLSAILFLIIFFIIGDYSFSAGPFIDGGVSASGGSNFTAFYGRELKLQPGIGIDSFVRLNYSENIYSGLSAGYSYAFSSDIDGGWSYPGFNGMTASFFTGFHTAGSGSLGAEAALSAGFYRYNLTSSIFFLPAVSLAPYIQLGSTELFDIFLDIPLTLHLHRQADFLFFAGIRMRGIYR